MYLHEKGIVMTNTPKELLAVADECPAWLAADEYICLHVVMTNTLKGCLPVLNTREKDCRLLQMSALHGWQQMNICLHVVMTNTLKGCLPVLLQMSVATHAADSE